MKVTLTPKGNQEDILKRIIVVSDDPKQPRFALTMQGKLLVDVRAEPATLALANLAPGASATLEFGLDIRDPATTKLESIAVEDTDNFELRPLEPGPDGQLRYELKFRGSNKLGNIGSRVEVRTSGSNTPELNIPIRASVVSNLRYSKRINLANREGEFVPRQIRISTQDKVPVKVSKVVDADGLLTLERREAPGGAVIIDVRVDEAKAAGLDDAARRQQRTLVIHTNDPDEPRAEVVYTLGVALVQGRIAR